MDDSGISINWKERPSSRRASDVNASSSKEGRKSTLSRTPSKFGWRNFFRIFRKSNSNKKICSPKQSQYEVARKEKDWSTEVYLHDVHDALAMAISLPEKVNGKDVQVSIELKAIGRQDASESETGLNIAEETASKTTFAGNIKIPSDTTIEQVANMPLYFVNPEKSLNDKGELSNKIETVIKPLDNNLPINVDKSMIVTNINLKVNLQNVDWKYRRNSERERLNYIFISNETNRSKSTLRSRTDDIVEEVSQTNMIYNEQSKTIVKDILSQVMEKVETHDMSTQYYTIKECVNKEVDVQKSLLLNQVVESSSECNSSQAEPLSRITEENEDGRVSRSSEESVYPNSTTTHSRISNISLTESEGSMYYLKAPTNTPNTQVPKYVIKYDERTSRRKYLPKHGSDISVCKATEALRTSRSDVENISANKRNKVIYQQVLHEDIRADIDKTLELLETAKNKLLSYLDNAMDLVEFTRDYKDKYPQAVIWDNMEKQVLSQRDVRDPEQFFLGEAKNADLISFSMESFRIDGVPKLNTLQNIYSEDEAAAAAKFEEVLKERYSGDGKVNNLTYDVVENDINFMIRELLSESNEIKEFVLGSFSIQNDALEVVKSVIDHVMEQVVPELDPPKINQNTICVNYCLVDEIDRSDATQATIAQKKEISTDGMEDGKTTDGQNGEVKREAGKTQLNKTQTSKSIGIGFRPQHKSLPRISVKKFNPSKKYQILKSEDSLMQRLEKGTAFLRNIYGEICATNYECDNRFAPTAKQKLEKVDSSSEDNVLKSSQLLISETQGEESCVIIQEFVEDKVEAQCNLLVSNFGLQSLDTDQSTMHNEEFAAETQLNIFNETCNNRIRVENSLVENKVYQSEQNCLMEEVPTKAQQYFLANINSVETALFSEKYGNENGVPLVVNGDNDQIENRLAGFSYLKSKDVPSEGQGPNHALEKDCFPKDLLENTYISGVSPTAFQNNLEEYADRSMEIVIDSIKPNLLTNYIESNNVVISYNCPSTTYAPADEGQVIVLQQDVSASNQIPNSDSAIVKKGDTNSKEATQSNSKQNVNPTDKNLKDEANRQQETYLLKKAAKILKEVEIEERAHNKTSQEEVIQYTYDLAPKVAEKHSSYSTIRRQREEKFQYSSSSSEDHIRTTRKSANSSKYVSQKASDAINKDRKRVAMGMRESFPFGVNSSGNIKNNKSDVSSHHSLPLSLSDYDADLEASSFALPNFRYEYESREDLNDATEVEFIENNAAVNLKLNPPQHPDLEVPVICESVESFTTSLTIDSETSLEQNDYNYDKTV